MTNDAECGTRVVKKSVLDSFVRLVICWLRLGVLADDRKKKRL